MAKWRWGTLCSYFILLLCFVWRAESQPGLYPYGSGTNDRILTNVNDEPVASLELLQDFRFGGKYHRSLYISPNGIISFEEAITKEPTRRQDRNIPFYYNLDDDIPDENPDAILAYWTDVDTTGLDKGNVYYRQLDGSDSLLEDASVHVRAYFRSNQQFTAQAMVIVTWELVSFYHQEGSLDPRNTFQTALVYDSQESFVFFLYDQIEWTMGTTLGGDPETGLYGSGENYVLGMPLIGFNMGDKQEKLEFSQNMLLTLNTLTNVETDDGGEAGIYAYKVDGERIIDPACDSESPVLGITPNTDGMMGGQKIYLYGPCWDASTSSECVFTYMGREIQRVTARVESNNEAYCVPEPFFLVGEVTLTVVEEEGTVESSPSATYSLIEGGRLTPTVTRSSSGSTNWNTAGNANTIRWASDSFAADTELNITVMAYREDGSTGPRWETVYVISNDTSHSIVDNVNENSYTFTSIAVEGVTEDNAFGVIRIAPNNDNPELVLWSDIHPLGYLLEEAYQAAPADWASDKCQDWLIVDNTKGEFTAELPACPCTLSQAREDVGTFMPSPSCNENEGACTDPDSLIKHCVLSAYARDQSYSGTKCCYDTNEMLMYAADTATAGMSARSHVRGSSPYMQQNRVPELSHWTNDLIAKHLCCEWASDEDCFQYRQRRPTSDCSTYQPPNIALTFGDPHFITLDGNNFTFNGLGEYTLLRLADEATGVFEFELQGRQVKSQNEAGNLVAATQLSSVAMKDTNSDTIFIDASPSSGMNVYRKAPGSDAWSYVYWMQQIFVDLQGCAVGRTNREGELDGVVAMFKESGISVHVMYDQGMLAVQPILPSSVETDQGNKLHGLLGNMNGDPDDDLKRRDTGEPLVDPTEEEILQFGQTWEIESDSELFYYTGSSDHSTYHNTSFVPLMNVNLPTLFPPCEDNKWCLFDYAATGDNEAVALATLGANNAFYQSLEGIQKIDACPFISPPFNGSKTYMSMTNKQFEDAQVYFSCDYPLILVGSAFRVCQYDSEDILGWTGSADAIQCIESQCGFLESPQNGSISLETNGLLAEFSCDEGFSLDGAAEAQCDLTTGEWSATPPSCSVPGEPVDNNNAVVIAVSVVMSIIVVVAIIIGVIFFLRYRQSGSINLQKAKPQVKTKEAEINWGMEYDTIDVESINPDIVPAKTPQPSNETPYL